MGIQIYAAMRRFPPSLADSEYRKIVAKIATRVVLME